MMLLLVLEKININEVALPYSVRIPVCRGLRPKAVSTALDATLGLTLEKVAVGP